MTTVKVLVEGYAKRIENGYIASSTVSLIYSEDKIIICDPGCNRRLLMEALEKEGLRPCHVNYVFLSHSHPDHILLTAIFENAKVISYDSNLLFDKDKQTTYDINILGSDIETIDTPGHVSEHKSLIVKTENETIGISGDVFWWYDKEEELAETGMIANNENLNSSITELKKSRKLLLEKCDSIIPGHGKLFHTNNLNSKTKEI